MVNCIPFQYWTEFDNYKVEKKKDKLNLSEFHALKQINLKAVTPFGLTSKHPEIKSDHY
jgi:hypothetical protein